MWWSTHIDTMSPHPKLSQQYEQEETRQRSVVIHKVKEPTTTINSKVDVNVLIRSKITINNQTWKKEPIKTQNNTHWKKQQAIHTKFHNFIIIEQKL